MMKPGPSRTTAANMVLAKVGGQLLLNKTPSDARLRQYSTR